jgi:hypothetical protein
LSVFRLGITASKVNLSWGNWIHFLTGRILPVTPILDASGLIVSATVSPEPAIAVAMIPDPTSPAGGFPSQAPLWVFFHGGFVMDASGRAICSDFVRAQLPTGEIPKGGNFGIEGGIFESWFISA